MTGEDVGVVRLEPWYGPWEHDDPDAGFKADVATYAHADPMPALHGLSRRVGLPVGVLARYALARWCAAGSEALLALGPDAVARMVAAIEAAEEAGTDAARLDAYATLRGMVSWLAAPDDEGDDGPGDDGPGDDDGAGVNGSGAGGSHARPPRSGRARRA